MGAIVRCTDPVHSAVTMNPVPPSGQVQQPELFPQATPARAPGAAPEGDLAQLAAACGGCRRCGLALGRQQVVVSRGNPASRLMVIGEGPGAQEDVQGLPFVGRAGQLLDQMLASVAIDSNREAYICNVVKCRPPDNRKPTAEEMAACTPWLERQIQLVDPAVILLAGATAMEGVLGVKGGITRLRGQWRQGSGEVLGGRWLMPIFHPSYLLRNPSREQGSPKWLTWQDLQDVRRRLDQLAG
jgi:uracil-DNA glycosylase family 4